MLPKKNLYNTLNFHIFVPHIVRRGPIRVEVAGADIIEKRLLDALS